MSITKETKRGRPKGSKNKPKPTEPLKRVDPQETDAKNVEEKAIKEILGTAELAAGSMLQEEPEFLGKSPETNAAIDPGQADFLPGTMQPDPTYLPEFAYDEGSQVDRRVTYPSDYHYIWVADVLVTKFRARTYKFCIYDGGPASGLAENGFRGTGLYERTLDNHIRNGDTFLMYLPMRAYEQIVQRDADQVSAWESAAQKDLHNEGYKRGVRTFEEVDGQLIYN